jgi:hypothetical protein
LDTPITHPREMSMPCFWRTQPHFAPAISLGR